MKAKKNIGIWMDYSRAHLIEFRHGITESRVIESALTPELRQETLATRGEHTLHRKEQQLTGSYFHTLSEQILKFDEVLLFGPTDAKKELLSLIRSDHRFSKINVTVQNADKMTEAQQHALVRDYFLSDENF